LEDNRNSDINVKIVSNSEKIFVIKLITTVEGNNIIDHPIRDFKEIYDFTPERDNIIKEVEPFVIDKKINSEYDWIFLKQEINLPFIFNKIDPVIVSEQYISSKYPDLMSRILEVEKLEGEDVLVFLDKHEFGDSFYLGEWKRIPNFIRHGRGMYHWYLNNTTYIGQLSNDCFYGKGKFYYENGDVFSVFFREGKIDGECEWKDKDNNLKKCIYKEGVLVEE
jgi:hypothetical protein